MLMAPEQCYASFETAASRAPQDEAFLMPSERPHAEERPKGASRSTHAACSSSMNFFVLEVIIGGLLTGVLYSLVALGFVLIFKASGVFNFAQGAMCLFAALALVRLMECDADGAGIGSGGADHARARLRDRAIGVAAAGQPGRPDPVHGDDRDHLLHHRLRPGAVRQRRLHARPRHPEKPADPVRRSRSRAASWSTSSTCGRR